MGPISGVVEDVVVPVTTFSRVGELRREINRTAGEIVRMHREIELLEREIEVERDIAEFGKHITVNGERVNPKDVVITYRGGTWEPIR